jgi:F-type H+-transporting ATPase subunit alpha
MAVSLFAVNQGYLDDVPTKKVVDFEAALQSYMGAKHKALLDRINATGDYNEEIEKSLHAAVKDFKSSHTW